MPHEGEPLSVYRIERQSSGVLHLYRGEHLVDVDSGSDDHSLEDGTRPKFNGEWQILVGVPYRYVTWQADDDGMTAWDEIDDSTWATRHIEAIGPEQTYTTAASLAEVIAARDTGGIEAVRAYEQTYGVVPEAAFPGEIISSLTTISPLEFFDRRIAARNAL